MATGLPNLLVSVADRIAFVKIVGRANFANSVHFKTLVLGLHDRGIGQFILELTECVNMDSTFLGVLAGLALPDGEAAQGDGALAIELFNPNPKVRDLLENLGVADLFKVVECAAPDSTAFSAVAAGGGAPSREELSETCLKAHQTLMAINPENVPKFKEVTQFLAEDLKKAKGGS